MAGEKKLLKNICDDHPLLFVLTIALVVRIIAVFFAKGYGMHDDHFCVIETAQNWINGIKLPSDTNVPIRNFIYTGFHYIFFWLMESVSIYDPEIKMFFVRLLHALYSLITVWFGFKIARYLSDSADKKTPFHTGIVLALFWIVPFMAVRNLVEMVCIPALLIAVYLCMRDYEAGKKMVLMSIAAGASAAFSFVIRYQVASFITAMGIIMLCKREWIRTLGFTIGFVLTAVLLLGVPEYIIVGQPFATLIKYAVYNSSTSNIYGYPVNPWYTYIGTVIALLIPPASLLFLWGFFKNWKLHAYLFFPTGIFFVFHSLYPNKQERFILPVLPFLLIGGVIGWRRILKESNFTINWDVAFRYIWRWFWVVNTFLLVLSVFTYSKKTRVASMNYFYDKKEVGAIVAENQLGTVPFLPTFYAGRSIHVYQLPRTKSITDIAQEIDTADWPKPQYIIYFGDNNIDQRVARTKALFPDQEFKACIEQSFVDKILHRINPEHNINQTCYIYKIIHHL